MRRDTIPPLLRAALIGLGVAIVLFAGLRLLGVGSDSEKAGEQPLLVPVRVKSVDGETRLVIAKQDLAAGGIGIESSRTITYQDRVPAFGTVISPQALAEQQRAYQAAAADMAHTDVAVKAARLEIQRLQPLHRDDRIVSDKALESAQGTLETEEANLKLAISQLRVQQATIEQQWGPVLGRWLVEGAPQLDRLLAGQDRLVQIAAPAGRQLADPTIAQLEPAPGAPVDATIISGVPQADPKFQSQSFLAVAPADPRLRPGMQVPVMIFIGSPVTGILVPDAAIVRWQGRPSIYVAVADGEFARRSVSTEIMTPEGWLVRSGLPAGAPVVVTGAQLLLSEEIKARSPGGNSK